MAHLVNSVSDVLEALQRERGLGRPRVKADLQRAPSRGARPRGCANGETCLLSEWLWCPAPGGRRVVGRAAFYPPTTCPWTLLDKDELLL